MFDNASTITNPVLSAITALPDDDLNDSGIVDVSSGVPDIASWLVALGNVLAAERLARQGGQRPSDTNALVIATNQLTPESFGALLAALHELTTVAPDGPRRRLYNALGLLLAIQARTPDAVRFSRN